MELSLALSLPALAGRVRGGPSYQPESLALFAAMTTPPTAARKAVIDTMIKALKASGDWNETDALWMPAAADSQAYRLNWKDASFSPLVPVNSPMFTVDRGIKGDGSSSRLTFAYDANTFPNAKFTLNLSTVGVFLRQGPTSVGGLLVSHGATRIGTNGANTFVQARVNDNASGNMNALATGHYMAKRVGASARLFFRDGVQTLSDGIAATGLGTVSGNGGLLAFGGTAFSDAQISAAYLGGNINPVTMHAAILAYLQAIGAA